MRGVKARVPRSLQSAAECIHTISGRHVGASSSEGMSVALASRLAEHTIHAFVGAKLDLSNAIRFLTHTQMMRVRFAMFDAQS